MSLNLPEVEGRELMCEMYIGMLAWLSIVGGVGDITY